MNEIVEVQGAQVPSEETDRNKILAAIQEIDVSLTRIDSERDLIKAVAEDLKDEFGMGKRLVNRLAATYHKGDAEEVQLAYREFEEFYSEIVGEK